MNNRVNSFFLYAVLSLLFFGIFILSRIKGFSLGIGFAVPIILVPAVVGVAMFFGEWFGFIFGLACGMALDSVTLYSNSLNTFLLMTVGVLVGIITSNYLNVNIFSALVVSFVSSLIYFLVKWFFLQYLLNKSVLYLWMVSLPSFLYTAVFIVPLFYVFKFIHDRPFAKKIR